MYILFVEDEAKYESEIECKRESPVSPTNLKSACSRSKQESNPSTTGLDLEPYLDPSKVRQNIKKNSSSRRQQVDLVDVMLQTLQNESVTSPSTPSSTCSHLQNLQIEQ